MITDMQPITYYCPLSESTEEAINRLSLVQLVDLIEDLIYELKPIAVRGSAHGILDDSLTEINNLGRYEFFGLIKGLTEICQHKLMEEA